MSGLNRLISAGLIRTPSPPGPSGLGATELAAHALARRAIPYLPPGTWDQWSRGREPPAPFRFRPSGMALEAWKAVRDALPGSCPLCGQERFRLGAWWSAAGPNNQQGSWHTVCAFAWKLWTAPNEYANAIAARQGWVCPETGESLKVTTEWDRTERGLRTAGFKEAPGLIEVDHRVPLWRVRADAARYSWPGVLSFWGLRNLQALSPAGHRAKTRREAAERAKMKRESTAPPLLIDHQEGDV